MAERNVEAERKALRVTDCGMSELKNASLGELLFRFFEDPEQRSCSKFVDADFARMFIRWMSEQLNVRCHALEASDNVIDWPDLMLLGDQCTIALELDRRLKESRPLRDRGGDVRGGEVLAVIPIGGDSDG